MKIPINLASQPFRRDRALVAASLAVSAVLVATLGVLIYLAMVDRAQLGDLRHEIARLNRRIEAVNRQETDVQTILRQPANTIVLERSVLINTLLLHKGISWGRIFGDLENTVPYNVKITALHPTVNAQNHVSLDMSAASESPEGLFEFLRALESSKAFEAVLAKQINNPNQSEPLYRVRVTVNYAQKL